MQRIRSTVSCAVNFLVTQSSHDNASHRVFSLASTVHPTALDNEGEIEGILIPLNHFLNPFTLGGELPCDGDYFGAGMRRCALLSGRLSW